VLLIITFSLFFYFFFVRVYFLKRFYEKQGIQFVKDCKILFGSEIQVSVLRVSNKTHDYLYKIRNSDLIGTIRGPYI
jgi:hypothetical protein